MHGQRSLNLELTPLDPDLKRNIKRARRARVEMEDIPRNENREEQDDFQDARARHMEQRRAYDVDFTMSLRELFAPVATSSHPCIVLSPTNATHYDQNSHLIQMLPSFYGLDHENPYSHVKKFKNICATTKFQKLSEEAVHLRLFPFSLHDRAMEWLDSNAPKSITSWEELLKQFYSKFFSMSRVNEHERISVPLLRTRTKNSLSVGRGSRICSSNAPLMVMKNGDSFNSSTKGFLNPTIA